MRVSHTLGSSGLLVTLVYSVDQLRIHQRKPPKRAREFRHRVEHWSGLVRWSEVSSTRVATNSRTNSRTLVRKGSQILSMSGIQRSEQPSFMERVKANPLFSFFDGASGAFKADELGKEIAVIALPALVALAADPLASLVDIAFIGRIGPVELAAVGVSIQVFNVVSKTFNMPLLNVTTSFVAEDEAAIKDAQLESSDLVPVLEMSDFLSLEDGSREELLQRPDGYSGRNAKPVLTAVSSALVMGTGLGLIEAAVLTMAAEPILTVMGVGVDSSMRAPAVQYLALRAIGAPAVVVALAVQGVFRGFKDTKTPLYASVLGNFVNIVLDPILIFTLNFGVSGAAFATVISQYIIALVLLWILNKRVTIVPPSLRDLGLDRYFKSGSLLLGRTLAVILSLTLATSMAARQGAIPMAAHQICMQVWLAASLLSDSLALAGQAIIASAFAKRDYTLVKAATFRVLQMSLGFGILIAVLLALGSGWFPLLFTSNVEVLQKIALLIPVVVATQPINSLAFAFDGLYFGVSDFGFAAVSMITLAVPSCLVLLVASPIFGLSGVWMGLTVLMTLRMLAGFLRVGSCTGPWKLFLNGLTSQDVDFEDPPR